MSSPRTLNSNPIHQPQSNGSSSNTMKKNGGNEEGEETFTTEELTLIHNNLLEWFDIHRRKLPWRGDDPPYGNNSNTNFLPMDTNNSSLSSSSLSSSSVTTSSLSSSSSSAPKLPSPNYHNPYGTWISEVMCQQTRIDTVIPYWLRWMERFPTPQKLAESTIDEVNSLWAGLGYYRRAHNLHKGAQTIMNTYQGILPATVEGLKSIPGIGEYTAGAIASISFGLAVPLVDGNVSRVLARIKALSYEAKSIALNKSAWRIAGKLVPVSRPGDFNQALMELGATLCSPRSVPLCQQCPLQKANVCKSFRIAKEKITKSSDNNSSSTVLIDIEEMAGPSSAKKEVKKTKVQSTLSFGGKLTVATLPASETKTETDVVDGLTSQQWKDITTYILQHHPVPFEKKKAVPVQKVHAVVIEAIRSDTHESKYLMLRTLPLSSSSSSSGTKSVTPKRNNALLERQWQPYMELIGSPENPVTNKKSKRVAADNDDENDETDGDENENTKANSDSEDIEIIETTSTSATKKPNTKTASGTKRVRKSNPESSISAVTLPVTPSIVTIVEQYLRTLPTSVNIQKGPGGGKVNHAFSHVIHDINVDHYVIDLSKVDDNAATDQILSAILKVLQKDTTLALTPSSVEMLWAKVIDFEALGLTTWTTKVLYPCLNHKVNYQTVRSSLSSSTTSTLVSRTNTNTKGSIDSITPEEIQAWKLLHSRWEKSGSC